MDVQALDHVKTSLKPTNHPYLTGPWTPTCTESTAIDFVVIEDIILYDIDGICARNAENQVHHPLGNCHPFDSDGMVHVITFRNGKAHYRNRFVRTRGFEAERDAGQSFWGGLMYPPGTS